MHSQHNIKFVNAQQTVQFRSCQQPVNINAWYIFFLMRAILLCYITQWYILLPSKTQQYINDKYRNFLIIYVLLCFRR